VGYPVTLNEEDFELFRLARILDKQKVIKLLKEIHSRKITIDHLLSMLTEERKEKVGIDEEALSFILTVIKEKFTDVKIPEKLQAYVKPIITPKGAEAEVQKIPAKITPQKEYTLPILESLMDMGGKGRIKNVLAKVFEKMKDKLTPDDMQMLPSGKEKRWENRARWEIYRLSKEGLIKRITTGLLEITDEGRKHYEELKRKS